MAEEHEKHEAHHVVHHEQKSKIKISTVWMVIAIALAVLLAVSVFFNVKGNVGGLSKEQAGEKAINYIKTNLLQPGMTAVLVSSEDANGLYNIKLNISGKSYDSYITKDGSLFFPSAITIEVANTSTQQTAQTQQAATVPKTDKPKVEAFVMAYCPYGTQIEKGIIPVIELLGSKIDSEIKFVYYAMHGEKEVKEELQQYCIQKEQNSKYLPYLKCFLNASDGTGCLTTAGVDKDKLATCVAATDKEFNVMKNFNDQSSWLSGNYPLVDLYKADNEKYSVGGSPTFVINGISMGDTSCKSDTDCHVGEKCVQMGSGSACSMPRDSESLKKAICAAFTTAPSECSQTLSSASPSAGFGYAAGASGSASGACG